MPSSPPTSSAMNHASFRSDPTWIQFTPPWEPDTKTAVIPCCSKEVAIVIADDDATSREITSTIVSGWGFRTIVARDGHEAMAAIRAEKGPVVAILDWMMPGIDGLQVCQRVRKNGMLVHIIVLTVRAAKENLVEALESGADDYLVKPFNKNELLARIHVGIRMINLQNALTNRVKELEDALLQVRKLQSQLSIPL